MPTKVESKENIAKASIEALAMWNRDYNTRWSFGENWSSVAKSYETFIQKYLFPKIQSTDVVNVALGNRFDWLAVEEPLIGQLSEEYVIMDTVPIDLNLSKDVSLVLQKEYPRIATKLYHEGTVKKVKFTLNNNDQRLNFSTLGDAVKFATNVYKKKISDINVSEESEIKGMLLDYALNVVPTAKRKTVTSSQELFTAIAESILNIQNNSANYNEAYLASGGAIGRYTTTTRIQDIVILTNDAMKVYALDTKLANTFQAAGIDITDRIISFDDLGGVYRITQNITISDTNSINYLRQMGDYQTVIGDTIHAGAIFTYDVKNMSEFVASGVGKNYEEIRPSSNLFAFILDIGAIRYKRDTQNMLQDPFRDGERGEVTWWLHYYQNKIISPFYNKIVITQEGV